MKKHFDAEKFAEEIATVRKYVGRGLHNAVLLDATHGNLQLRATGGGINLRMASEATVEGLEMVVMSQDGFNVLAGYTGETTVTTSGNKAHLVGSMDLELNLLSVPPDVFDFPVGACAMQGVPPEFSKLMYAQGDPNQFRNVLWIDGDIAACNNRERFAIYKADRSLYDGQVAIRTDYAKLMAGGMFGLSNNRAWYEMGDVELTFPLMGDTPLGVTSYMAGRPGDYSMQTIAEVHIPRQSLIMALSVMCILSESAEDRKAGVTISFGNPLTIYASGNELGRGDTQLPADHHGEVFDINMSSKYLLEALTQIETEDVYMQVRNIRTDRYDNKMLVLVDEPITHVILPRA